MSADLKRSHSPFHVLIKPAGPACNLRCEYCFYLEKEKLFAHEHRADFMMNFPLLEELLEQIILSQPENTREISIGWQGGEPTLCGVDFFRKAVEIEKKLAPEGVKITNGFQTNGILINEEWADFFFENEFLIGLSLDGPEKYHNKYRKDRAGSGTFKQVMRALDLFKRKGVQFNTLTCIQHDNAGAAAEIYRFLRDSGSAYHQYIPIIEPAVNQRQQVSSRSVTSSQWGKFLIELFKVWLKDDDIGKVFIQHIDSFLGGYMGEPGGICVYNPVCGRSIAAEHNGSIYSCDHFVSEETLLGNILETPLTEMVDSAQQKFFGESKYTNLPEFCRKCRYLKLCYGECPKNRLLQAASNDGKLNYLCAGFKKFFIYSEPYFKAMAAAVSNRYPAAEYKRFL